MVFGSTTRKSSAVQAPRKKRTGYFAGKNVGHRKTIPVEQYLEAGWLEIETQDMGRIIVLVDYTDNFAAAPLSPEVACISTGRTLDDVKRNMEEALQFHLDGMREDGLSVPDEFASPWEFEWRLSTRALLHYTEGLVSRSAIARITGINQQQLSHYASGYRKPRPAMSLRIREGVRRIAQELAAVTE